MRKHHNGISIIDYEDTQDKNSDSKNEDDKEGEDMKQEDSKILNLPHNSLFYVDGEEGKDRSLSV